MLKNLETLLASSQTLLPLENDELIELPVFPLPRVVMFPFTIVPFHLFEPRYTAMMKHCLEHGPHAIAVVNVIDERNETMSKVASVGRILAHKSHSDGTYDIALAFVSRVVVNETPSQHPFRICRAEMLCDEVEDLEKQSHAAHELRDVLQQVRVRLGLAPAADDDANDPFATNSALQCPTSFRWADMLVGDAADRQKILEECSATKRLVSLRQCAIGILAEIALKGPLN